MKRENLEAYITQFGNNRINIRGLNSKKFLTQANTELIERKLKLGKKEKVISTVVISFESEEKMFNTLQKFVDHGLPFCDDYKSTAFMDACDLSAKGILKGKILAC